MKKRCSVCLKNKDRIHFAKDKKVLDGLRGACRECTKMEDRFRRTLQSTKDRERKAKEKRAHPYNMIMLEYFKKGCIDCGTKDIIVLEFDHISNKKYGIADLRKNATSIKQFTKELDKCVVRCGNCHKHRTAEQFGNWRLKYKDM